jgi:phenylacetate-CoA ligase
MRRMEKVTGRSDDMIILRGVNVFPTQIEEQLLKVEGLSPHFQLVLDREGRMDTMTVNVEVAPGHTDRAERRGSAVELENRIKEVVGVSVKVEVKDIESVARSQGKAVRIIDNRPKE